MTSMRSLAKLGKQPGQQIQDAVAIWGSTPPRRDAKLSGGFGPLSGAADFRTFEVLHMPKLAARPLRSSFCCFPHASPNLEMGAEKLNTAPKGRSTVLISVRKIGAGEGIRTPDPNLGKGARYPIRGPAMVSQRPMNLTKSKGLIRQRPKHYPTAGVVGGHHVDTTIE